MSDTPSLQPGQRLDRYELICPIAKGGMAHVWVARLHGKHGFEKLVALKTILPELASEKRFQAMFLDEARIACAIEHPNVAQTLDLGEENGVLYLAMEWVDGEAFSKLQRASSQPIPLPIVLRVLADVSAGLHAAHELRSRDGELLNVVHRDVSPQNILVTTQGVSKVIDFGIAKATNRRSEDTNTGVMKGKPSYMAPEQALGQSVDRGADIWAVGAMLYASITGRPPYEGDNQLELLHRLTSGQPYPMLPLEVPREVAAIVIRCLQHRREDRYDTAADLQQELEQAMVSLGRVATAKDVGSYLQKHLGDRLRVRRDAVSLGLRASEERKDLSVRFNISVAELATTPSHLKRPAPLERPLRPDSFDLPIAVEPEVATHASAVSFEGRPATAGRRRPLFIGLGLLAALGIGLTVFAFSSSKPKEAPTKEAPAAAQPTPVATPSAAQHEEPAAAPTPTPSAAPSVEPSPVKTTKSSKSHPAPTATTTTTTVKKKPKPGDDLGF